MKVNKVKKVKFVYPAFARHAEAHPELLDHVPCEEYFGPPSLGIACLAAMTPPDWEVDFRDDRLEDVGLDDDDDTLVALSFFTAAASRGLALADAFRARGKQVVAGGIFPSMMPDLTAQHVDAVVVGEAEGVWRQVLADAATGTLRPRYTQCEAFDLAQLPLPRVDLYMEKEGRRFTPDDYPVQNSRGCPLKCSACVLPSQMGRKLRPLPLAHVLGQIDQLAARGKRASITEDTSFFFGNGARRRFGLLLDALAERPGAATISYIGISMPLILTTSDDFLERLRRAGVKMFYLVGGFDPITQQAFSGTAPKALQRAYDAITKAQDHGIEPYTSFLVGNDGDDAGVFDRMLEFGKRAGIAKAEFAIRTPYPGTPQWHALLAEDRIHHRDWSRYNDANVVFEPLQMTAAQLQEGYLHLWREFYRDRSALGQLAPAERTIQF